MHRVQKKGASVELALFFSFFWGGFCLKRSWCLYTVNHAALWYCNVRFPAYNDRCAPCIKVLPLPDHRAFTISRTSRESHPGPKTTSWKHIESMTCLHHVLKGFIGHRLCRAISCSIALVSIVATPRETQSLDVVSNHSF